MRYSIRSKIFVSVQAGPYLEGYGVDVEGWHNLELQQKNFRMISQAAEPALTQAG